LVFVGSGPEEKRLKECVQEQSVPDVFFMGFRNQSELPKFYALSDVFVLPSVEDRWGLVINEVMSAGLPVIASDEIGAVPDLVKHGHNGFVFPAGNVASLAGYLEQLVNDENLRKEMGHNSEALIAQWDIERAAQGVIDAVRFVVGKNRQLPK